MKILLLALIFFTSNAIASPETRRAAIASTASEASLSFVALVKEKVGGEIQDFGLNIKYSDRNWTVDGKGTINHKAIKLFLEGVVWGDDGQDMEVTYAGNGLIGAESMSVQGKTNWPYNLEKKDYFTTSFNQVSRFAGKNDADWIYAGEVLVGAVIGGGGTIAAVVATAPGGPVAMGLVAWIGIQGGLNLGNSLLSTSATIRSQSAQPPKTFATTAMPVKDEIIRPAKNMIYVVLDKSGRVLASGPDGTSILEGNITVEKDSMAKFSIREIK